MAQSSPPILDNVGISERGTPWTPENWGFYQDQVHKTVELHRYRTDAVVVAKQPGRKPPESAKRGEVGKVSSESLRRLVFLLNNSTLRLSSMLTMTYQRRVEAEISVKAHKQILHAALARLRRAGVSGYVWVREHQKSGAVHWHIFTDQKLDERRIIDEQQSRSWSRWLSEISRSKIADPHGLKDELRRMRTPVDASFRGCCRYETFTNPAGRYMAKEGAKRIQKVAAGRWKKAGRWWGASRSVVVGEPVEVVEVDPDSLQSVDVVTPEGVLSVLLKYQFGEGIDG